MKNTEQTVENGNDRMNNTLLHRGGLLFALTAFFAASLLFLQGCGTGERTPVDPTVQTLAETPTPAPTPEPQVLDGRTFFYDETDPSFTGLSCTAEDVTRILDFLEDPVSADLSDSDFSTESQLELVGRFPETDFIWNVDVFGTTVSSQAETLDLNDTELPGIEALEELLPLFPHLLHVDMLNCPGEDEDIYQFTLRHPDTRFIWTAHLGVVALPTNITSFCRNIVYGGPTINDEYLDVQLRYFPDLIALDVGHGHHSITRCDWLQYAPKLEYLIIAICQIQDITPVGELKNLKYLEVFTNPGLTDISALGKLQNLKTLNISNLEITDYTPLYSCKSLENCWILMNRIITDDQMAELQAALPNCHFEHYYYPLFHPTTVGWRQLDAYFEMRDAFGAIYYQ